MNIHKNAGLTPRGRGILILRLERGEHPQDVTTATGISVRTVYKWGRRYRAEGIAGLQDRSSRPQTSPDKTPDDVERVMTSNGPCYKSFAWRDACEKRDLKHIRTKPYTPKTNGKAERFIQSSLREWATQRPMKHPTTEPGNCPTGCIITIGTGPTPG